MLSARLPAILTDIQKYDFWVVVVKIQMFTFRQKSLFPGVDNSNMYIFSKGTRKLIWMVGLDFDALSVPSIINRVNEA